VEHAPRPEADSTLSARFRRFNVVQTEAAHHKVFFKGPDPIRTVSPLQ
jgi:hypothetical protein